MKRLAAFAVLIATVSILGGAARASDETQIVEGRFFDGLNEVIENGVIVIANGRILCAGERGECAEPEDAARIKVSKGTLAPGLIDLHVHTRAHYVGAFLPAGVTTIRDANNTLETIEALRARKGAPRIIASGPMLDGAQSVMISMSETAGRPGEQPWETIMPVIVETAADARQAVHALAKQGVDVIKLYEQLPPEAYRAAVEAADDVNLPVMTDLGLATTRGLSGARVDALEAAEWGVSSLEHLSGVALAYKRLGGDPYAEELNEALVDQIADRLAATNAAVVPTLCNTVHFAVAEPVDVSDTPLADVMEPKMGEWWARLHDYAMGEEERAEGLVELRLSQALLPRLKTRGVIIGAGTDTPAAPYTVPGGGIHQELAYLVEFGLTPKQALRAATGDAARILRRDDLGVIREGAVADIIAVAGDPARNILATRKILWVMAGGELHTPEDWRALTLSDENAQSEDAQ